MIDSICVGVHEQVVADLEPSHPQGVGDDPHLLLVGPQRHHRPLRVQLLLEDHHVALDLVAGGLDDVEALVEDELLAGLEGVDLERGVLVDLHLAALGQDVDGAVLVGRQVDAVGAGWGAELIDLFLERGDLLARLVERVDQLLVLVERLREVAVRLA